MENEEKFLCSECLGENMVVNQLRNSMVCKNCGFQCKVDDYLMSMEIFNKTCVENSLRMFLQPGTAVATVIGDNKRFLVGFNEDYELTIILDPSLKDDEIGKIFDLEENQNSQSKNEQPESKQPEIEIVEK